MVDHQQMALRLGHQPFVEKRKHSMFCALGVGAFEAVTRTCNGFEFRFHPRRAQAVGQPDCLLVGDVLIIRSVNRKHG